MAKSLPAFIDEDELLTYVAHNFAPDDVFDRTDLISWADDTGVLGYESLHDAWEDATSHEVNELILDWLHENGVPEDYRPNGNEAEYLHDTEHHGGTVRYCQHPLCRMGGGY